MAQNGYTKYKAMFKDREDDQEKGRCRVAYRYDEKVPR